MICWAIIGGLGASLLLPSMQSLIHGNFEGAMQRQAYALVGAAAAIAAAVGPLIGGFITTYLSWRIAFLGEAVIIAIVLSARGCVHDVPYTGDRARSTSSAPSCRRSAWAASSSGSWSGRRAAGAVGGADRGRRSSRSARWCGGCGGASGRARRR